MSEHATPALSSAEARWIARAIITYVGETSEGEKGFHVEQEVASEVRHALHAAFAESKRDCPRPTRTTNLNVADVL